MSRFTNQLVVGNGYDRKVLAELWGLAGYQAIGKGVFTPRQTNKIFLFVTRERLSWMTRYTNRLDDDLLFWDGEKGHGNDDRIINAAKTGDEIHLFYRDQRHRPFVYYGNIILLHFHRHTDRSSEFVFQVVSQTTNTQREEEPAGLAEDPAAYKILSQAGFRGIDQEVLSKSRGVAQRVFRGNLLRLWQGSCAVTSVHETRVLRSSHIKPWASSDSGEKVDHFNGLLLVPNLDALFNEGLISFRDDGRALVSSNWELEDKRRMHVTRELCLRKVHTESKSYLEYHRDVVFLS